MKIVAQSNQLIRLYDLKQLDFEGLFSSLQGKRGRQIFITSRSHLESRNKNPFHASGLLRRGIIKLSD